MAIRNYLYDASGNGNNLVSTNFTHSTGPAFYDATKQLSLEGHEILKYYDLNVMSGSVGVDSNTLFISQQYTSASLHDNTNRSQLKNFIPAWIFEQDTDPAQGGIGYLKAHLHIIARELDQYKVFIDQFPYILSSKNQRYNKTPSSFLSMVAENYGFPFKTILDGTTPSQWFNDLRQRGSESTVKYDIESINNVFWQRILTNLGYIYKKKGTRSLLEAMMRIYGIPQDIFRIIELGGTQTRPKNDKVSEVKTVREYAIRPSGSDGIAGNIRALPNSTATQGALNIGAGGGGESSAGISGAGPAAITIESRFRLNDTITNTYQTIWEMRGSSSVDTTGKVDTASPGSASYMTLYLDTTAASNYPPTASLVLLATRSLDTSTTPAAYAETPVSLSLRLAPFSKSLAHYASVTILSASTVPYVRYALRVKRIDSDFINNTTVAWKSSSFSKVTSFSDANARGYAGTIQFATPQSWSFGSGAFFNRTPSLGEEAKWSYLSTNNDTVLEGAVNSFRIWNRELYDSEQEHHALNYRSFATNVGLTAYDDLKVAYGFEDNIASDANLNITVLDASTNNANASASGFTEATNPYRAYNSEILSVFPFFDDGEIGVDNIRTFKAVKNENLLAGSGSKFGIAFEANLCDELRRDQADLVFNFDTLNHILGNQPGQISSEDTYNSLEDLRKLYFNKRWRTNQTLKLNEYNQAMKYLAQNLDQVMKTLMPVRAYYAGSFFTIEPHILERKRNVRTNPNEFFTPPMRWGNILSSSFTNLSPLTLNINDMPQELLATQREIDAIRNLPLQDEYLRDMVASHDRLTNTVGFTKEESLDVDLGAVRKTKVRQSRNSPPKILKRYLQTINPFNTDVADGRTYNDTNLTFNGTDLPLSTSDDMWDEPGQNSEQSS